ncbi:PE-PGRS family protein [Streptomyces sp. PTM05]|uniref:PE-PGRS family protein n=1 Tax=Streptantibioticus parmotrematis TaxID=2873249 RepID=A0ABS7QYK7_9ACTN|nr:PE-PGRS family protein [Streptantibioticus parmotrematis]MBY8886874.1 PE-PGRS family protein [Streptantibioticus parmotrematis]
MGDEKDALRELLHRAGLEVVGHGRAADARPAAAAWRPVIAGGADPVLAVPDDHPELVAELNRQWHRLAVEHDVINAEGEFLISVANQGCSCCARGHWTRVRLADRWDLAGLLGPKPGQPEFVAMSLEGESVLGSTTEEYAVWFVVVNPFPHWLEASARAQAAESPQERETGWGTVLRCKTASPGLRRAWRDGLARNRAAPASVLLRLLDVTPEERLPFWLIYRELPEEVVDAWVAHPEWRVRKGLGERRLLNAAQRAELFQDSDPGHRRLLLACAVDERLALTDATYSQLAADPSPRVRAELALHRDLPVRHLTELAVDPDPRVREAAVARAWVHLAPAARTALLVDPEAVVRAEAVLEQHRSFPLSAADFTVLPSDRHRERAACTCVLSRELAQGLVGSPDIKMRGAVARNPNLDAVFVALLSQDPEPHIRYLVSVRPDLTEAERSRIAIEFDPRARCRPLPWVREREDDAEAMRRCATSSHVMLRRSAAWSKNLPADVVDLLAHDDDWVVRLFLAEHCAQAPAELLLEMVRGWNGYSAAEMVSHPNFPRQGTACFADDPAPAVRMLALLDPESGPELVERFSRDPDSGVRCQALRDRRLSTASVIRLLDDPYQSVRDQAAADPRLPTRVLARLLYSTATADRAAANPAVPESVMHHLLER